MKLKSCCQDNTAIHHGCRVKFTTHFQIVQITNIHVQQILNTEKYLKFNADIDYARNGLFAILHAPHKVDTLCSPHVLTPWKPPSMLCLKITINLFSIIYTHTHCNTSGGGWCSKTSMNTFFYTNNYYQDFQLCSQIFPYKIQYVDAFLHLK